MILTKPPLIWLACLFSALAATAGDSNAPVAKAGTNAPVTAKSQVFEVTRYEVTGNTLLREKTVEEIFSRFTGKEVSLEIIRKALGELQLAYRQRGYVTVGISLPQQQVTNGTVRVKVLESRLADIRVRGNRHYSRENILRSLPGLHTNQILNSHIFQAELDQANANRDRQIYPRIEPGPYPGTSALVLDVKDRFPLHARAEVDNFNTPGTPDLRVNLSAQYDNLWQRDHQLGLSYGFSPEKYKADGLMTDYLLDEPLISYYGGYYRIPLDGASIEEKVGGNPRFGYNEASHQFVLPPPGNTPDVTFYASASANDTGVKYGPFKFVTSTTNFMVGTFTSGRNLGVNENLGARFSLPLLTREKYRIGGFAGVDYKQYSLASYATNTTVTTSSYGADSGIAPNTLDDINPDPVLKNHVHYLPVNAGFDFSESDKTGSTSANLTATLNTLGNAKDFSTLSYSPESKARYAKFNASLSREQALPGGFSLATKAGAQAATSPLISNEQFALGGNSNVRGYYEGDDYGDSGWFGSMEIRTPFWKTSVASPNDFVPAWLRASVFADYGQRYLLDSRQGDSATRSFLGAGCGFTANINNHFDARLQVAFPLLATANTPVPGTRVYFSIGAQF